MRFEIEAPKPITIVFEGQEYEVYRPKIGAVKDLELKVEEAQASEKGGTDLIMDFIADCGLPQEIVRKLDPEQIEQLMNVLTPSKKK